MSVQEAVPDYTKRLNADTNWALREGRMFFQNESEVQKSLRRITGRLNDLGIDYAVVGGMALFLHGFRRFTEDIGILVTREGLKKLHEALEGSGYRPPFANSKNLRGTDQWRSHQVPGRRRVSGRRQGEAGRFSRAGACRVGTRWHPRFEPDRAR